MSDYKKAIAILATDLDYKAVCFQVAADNPAAFVAAYQSGSWEGVVKAMKEDGASKVEAIKFVRSETGMGLKEAKGAIEELAGASGWRAARIREGN